MMPTAMQELLFLVFGSLALLGAGALWFGRLSYGRWRQIITADIATND